MKPTPKVSAGTAALAFCSALLATAIGLSAVVDGQGTPAATEAPAGFDSQTNGLASQAQYEADRATYAAQETIEDGLGPTYNAQSCGECHQNPVTGGSSQVSVLHAGRYDRVLGFVAAPGGSLIQDRSTVADMQERVGPTHDIRALRITPSTMGAGFVEALSDATLQSLAAQQPRHSGGLVRGQLIQVPLLEAPGKTRIGRFGWKTQHASLVSFSADAYLNEMGITTPYLPVENTSMGRTVADYDTVADPEDDGEDVLVFARFMRSTKVPPRDVALAVTPDAVAGERLFAQASCQTCHVATLTTALPGTVVNGGTFTVPPALGNKTIHPYSDFLLHDIESGDGVVQNGGPSTAGKIRTAPLWGLRTRGRLMHDGLSLTFADAIQRHRGEAWYSYLRFRAMSSLQREQLLTFLRSL